jgi:hypothetical protein
VKLRKSADRLEGVLLHDVFQGPSRNNGSCGLGTDGEVGRVETSLKKLSGEVNGVNSGKLNSGGGVAESATSPRTRNSRPSAPISTPGRVPRLSSSHTHTYSNDGDCLVLGAFLVGRGFGRLPVVVEEAPSLNESEVGDEDLA